MEVLKDASATAIYGNRGANGEKLISTKSGKKEKQKFRLILFLEPLMLSKEYQL